MSAVRMAVKMVLLAFLFLFIGTSAAYADSASPASPVVVQQLTPQMVAGLIGLLVPVVVSLLARYNASELVKVFLNLALTAITGAVSALVVLDPATGQATFGWVPFLTAWLFAFVSSTIAYLGALKHFDVNNILLAWGGLFGQKKIDPPAPPEDGDL